MAARAEALSEFISNHAVAAKYGPDVLGWRQVEQPEFAATGIAELDALVEGCPRGQITEVAGPATSGRTTFLHSGLAQATRRGEYAALIDTCDSFDPYTAARAGADLRRFVWVRCGGNADHAMRAADLLLHSGGFGFLALDLADVGAAMLRRIPLSYWFRFRRVVEQSPAVFVVLSPAPVTNGGAIRTEGVVDIRQAAAPPGPSVTRSCSSLLVGMRSGKPVFAGETPFFVLDHVEYAAVSQKPLRQGAAFFRASAVDAYEPVGEAVSPAAMPVRAGEGGDREAGSDGGGLVPKPARSSTHAGDGASRGRRNVLTDKRSWHTHPSPFEKRVMDEEEVYPGRRAARDAEMPAVKAG